jgi:type IV secretion system protein VirB11
LPSTQIALVIGTVAAYYDRVVTADAPRLQAELPLGGERFQGLRPPLCAPAFVIRKHLPRVFSMAELLDQGTVTEEQANILLAGLRNDQNLLIAGATLSGKTVLLDTLLAEMPRLFGPTVRLVTIEDTRELIVDVENKVCMEATDHAPMRLLLQDTMRHNPGHIIVGEVRGAEAIEMLKSWTTGHGGSACTLHAGTPQKALLRIETAVEEGGMVANPHRIVEAVDLVVMMERRGSNQWGVKEMAWVMGWKDGQYLLASTMGGEPMR